MFLLAGAIWLLILVPVQIRQGRAAREFTRLGSSPSSYTRDSRRSLVWGILGAAVLAMIVRQ
jgi:uncharacterized membrane protein